MRNKKWREVSKGHGEQMTEEIEVGKTRKKCKCEKRKNEIDSIGIKRWERNNKSKADNWWRK